MVQLDRPEQYKRSSLSVHREKERKNILLSFNLKNLMDKGGSHSQGCNLNKSYLFFKQDAETCKQMTNKTRYLFKIKKIKSGVDCTLYHIPPSSRFLPVPVPILELMGWLRMYPMYSEQVNLCRSRAAHLLHVQCPKLANILSRVPLSGQQIHSWAYPGSIKDKTVSSKSCLTVFVQNKQRLNS